MPLLCIAEVIFIPKLTYTEAQNLYDSYTKEPRNMTVVIGDPYYLNITNNSNHRWWNHITRHITLNNCFSCVKTVTSITFLACFGAAILIQKSYSCVKKIDTFFNTRCSTLSFESEDAKDLYIHFKKYEVLLITYKKIHTLLTDAQVRSYFAYDIHCEETIDYALAYISLYEEKQLQLLHDLE